MLHNRLLCLLSLTLLTACSKPTQQAITPPTLVKVASAVAGPGAAPIVTTGIVATANATNLSFKLGGVVQRIPVKDGERVRTGQLLAELMPTEINAQVTQAQQWYEKAQRDLARGEALYTDQVIALEQLENLRTQANIARAQWQAAQFNGGQTRITAPAAGVVLRTLAEAHEVVAPGQPIVALGTSRGFIIKAAIADREATQLKTGDTATVTLDALPGRVLQGKVSELGGAAQPENGLFPIEVTLETTDVSLVTGMVAQLSLQPAASHNRLLHIPVGAVVAGVGDTASVFVLQDGKARKRSVEVAFFTRDSVAIRTGLSDGEQVITDGALYLSDGEAVQTQTTAQ